MTRPDSGDDQSPELSPDLWEPLSDDVFGQMLSAALDPLATPMDLLVIPDEDETLFEDDAAEDAPAGPDSGVTDEDRAEDLGDLDDLFDDIDGASDGVADGAYGDSADEPDDLDGGDVL